MVPLAHRRPPTPVEPTVGRLRRVARRRLPIFMAPDRRAADQRSALPPWAEGDSSIQMDGWRCPSTPINTSRVEPTVGRLRRIARRILPICMTPDRRTADQRSALPPWTAGDSSIRVDRGRCPSTPHGPTPVEPTVGRLPRIARPFLPICMAPDRKAADQRSALPPWTAGDLSIRVDRGPCPSAPHVHIPGRADRWSAAAPRAAEPADVHGVGLESS